MATEAREFERIRQDWEDLGDIDPTWFNVPVDDLKLSGWNIDAFLRSGRDHVARDMELLQGLGLTLGRSRALDLGCGVGRLTQALAAHFERVDGVDISSSMIDRARQVNHRGERCQFTVNAATDFRMFGDQTFDLVYAENVLQHVPASIIRSYLKDFARILKPGALLVFQIPLRWQRTADLGIDLRRLPRFHPRRMLNKLRGLTIGHDVPTRYHRLRRLGLPKKWLYKRWGLHPAIHMTCIEEAELRALLPTLGFTVLHMTTYTSGEMVHSKCVARR